MKKKQMIPSSCEDAKFNCKLQRWLMNLNIDNFEKKKNKLLSSIFVRNADVVKILVHEIFCIPKIRPKKISFLVKLVSCLFELTDNAFRNIREFVLDEAFHPSVGWRIKVGHAHLLRQLYLHNHYNLDDILKRIDLFPIRYEANHFINFLFFAPDLRLSRKGEYERILYSSYKLDRLPGCLRAIRNVMDEYSVEDWDKLTQKLNHFYEKDSMEYAIMNDDIQYFDNMIKRTEEEEEENNDENNEKFIKQSQRKYSVIDDEYNWDNFFPKNPFALSPLIQKKTNLIQLAAFYGSTRVFSFLEKRVSEIDDIEHYVCAGGRQKILRQCEQHDIIFEKSIVTAVEYRNNSVWEWIDRFKDVKYDWVRKDALLKAVESNSLHFALHYLELGVDGASRDDKWRTPLHLAAQAGHMMMLRLVGGCKHVDFNGGDEKLMTPLHYAAKEGRLDVIKYLVIRGSNPIAKDNASWTPLHFAAQQGDVMCLTFLASCRGVNVNATSETDWTPAHVASQEGHVEILKVLKNLRADLLFQDKVGNTPLHTACLFNHLNTVEYLISVYADVNAKNRDKKTPLSVTSNQKIKELLIANGAK